MGRKGELGGSCPPLRHRAAVGHEKQPEDLGVRERAGFTQVFRIWTQTQNSCLRVPSLPHLLLPCGCV